MWSAIASGLVALTLVGVTIIGLASSPLGAISAASTQVAPAAGLDGRTLFQRKGCIGCHSVAAAGLQSPMGFAPELSALAQAAPARRPGLTAEAYVRESIRSPQAYIVPGITDVQMPKLPISDAELDALVTFLLGDHPIGAGQSAVSRQT
jgi:cytochrome c oxidase subunit 2